MCSTLSFVKFYAECTIEIISKNNYLKITKLIYVSYFFFSFLPFFFWKVTINHWYGIKIFIVTIMIRENIYIFLFSFFILHTKVKQIAYNKKKEKKNLILNLFSQKETYPSVLCFYWSSFNDATLQSTCIGYLSQCLALEITWQ